MRSILQGDFSHTEDRWCEEGDKSVTFRKKVHEEDKVIPEPMVRVQMVPVL